MTRALQGLTLFTLVALTGCGDSNSSRKPSARAPSTPVLHSFEKLPQRLSAWGLFQVKDKSLSLNPGVVAYDVNMPLFSDYAAKLRTLWLPEQSQVTLDGDQFVFPIGTIVSKTFFYRKHDSQPIPARAVLASNDWRWQNEDLSLGEHHLVETRLLVREATGWQGVSYIWQGSDAHLAVAGDLKQLQLVEENSAPSVAESFVYHVPSRNECMSCHATDHSTKTMVPIGLVPAQLVTAQAAGSNAVMNTSQLTGWQANQWWAEPADLHNKLTTALPPKSVYASWNQAQPTAAQARAYLDANCAHCHNPRGAADTSALDLTRTNMDARGLGICKPPIAAGSGTGGYLYGIVPGHAEKSILWHRLQSASLGSRMPEIGRSLVHTEGVGLVTSWINNLEGACR